MKKLLVLMLTFMMLLSTVSVNAITVGLTSEEQDQVDAFTTGVFTIDNHEAFIDLLMLYTELTEKQDFKDAYETAFTGLLDGQKDRLESFGVTFDTSLAFANSLESANFEETALRDYLTNDNMAAFKAAIVERYSDFSGVFTSVELDKMADGFDEVDKILSLLSLSQMFDASSNAPFTISTAGTMTVNTTNVNTLMTAANALAGINIVNTAPIIDGFADFVSYYNGAVTTDKAAVKAYLVDYNLVKVETSTSTGGGTTPTPTVPVVTPTPTPTPTPTTDTNAQDVAEAAATVEVTGTVTVDATTGLTTSTVTVSTDTFATAITQATAATAASTSEDQDIQTIAVFEVTGSEDADVQEVSIPFNAISDAEGTGTLDAVTVKSPLGSVTFDTESIMGTGSVAPNTSVKVSMERVDVTTLTGVPADAIVVDFSISLTTTAEDGTETTTDVTKFAKPIKVKVPYVLKAGDDPESITVYFIDETGASVPVGGRYNASTGSVEFFIEHFSSYYAKASMKSFVDVASTHWAAKYIGNFAGKGFLNGTGEGKFAPEADITRAEFVAIVTRMYRLQGSASSLSFTDVPADAWYANAVAAAFEAGIINGTSATTFEPLKTITRQEAAVVIMNALKLENFKPATSVSAIQAKFTDYSAIASWAKTGVATVYREEIVGGKPNGTFDPLGNATRAEVAKMLTVLYNAK